MKITLFISFLLLNAIIPNAFADKEPINAIDIHQLDINKISTQTPFQASLNLPKYKLFETQHHKHEFERTKSGATDAIKLGMTPEQAEVSTNEDKERMGYNSIQIVSFEKQYDKKMDAEIQELSNRFKKS